MKGWKEETLLIAVDCFAGPSLAPVVDKDQQTNNMNHEENKE